VTYKQIGYWKDSGTQFTHALAVTKNNHTAHSNLGSFLVSQGKFQEALEHYKQAVKLRPYWSEMMEYLAWLIATHPELENRDTNEALRMAQWVNEHTNYQDPQYMLTLAASYAACGNFQEAAQTASKASDCADISGRPDIKNAAQKHLALYLNGKPYIETPSSK
jgi:tetratricopeptide (TPR) repeat protein